MFFFQVDIALDLGIVKDKLQTTVNFRAWSTLVDNPLMPWMSSDRQCDRVKFVTGTMFEIRFDASTMPLKKHQDIVRQKFSVENFRTNRLKIFTKIKIDPNF